MLRTAHWTVEIFLDEDERGHIFAEAFLLPGDGQPTFAQGFARISASDAPDTSDAGRTVATQALSALVSALSEASGGEPAGTARRNDSAA